MGAARFFVFMAQKRLALGFVGFAEDEFESHLFAAAEDGNADGVAGLVAVHEGVDILRVSNLLAVDGDDEVAAEHDGRVADVGLLIAAVQAGTFGSSAGPLDGSAPG
jgi:hypothetical protein